MKKISVLTIILACLCLAACMKSSKESSSSSVAIQPSDSIKIVLSDDITPKDLGLPWLTQDDTFAYLTEKPFTINKFNLSNGSWTQIPLEMQGPNGVKSLGSFKFINEDTLIYYPYNSPEFYLLGTGGKKLMTFKLHPVDLSFESTVKENPSIYFNGTTYGFPSSKYGNPSQQDFYEKHTLISLFDIIKKETHSIIHFPEEFHNEVWSSNDRKYTVLFTEDHIILNFSKSKYLYEYNYDGKLANVKLASYSGIKAAQPFDQRLTPVETALRREFNGYYSHLIKDRYENKYYRVGILYDAQIDRNELNTTELYRILPKRKLVLISLDENLKQISTHLLSGVSDNSYFQTEKGLFFESFSEGDIEDVTTYYNFKINN
jgi:hypothetical protein